MKVSHKPLTFTNDSARFRHTISSWEELKCTLRRHASTRSNTSGPAVVPLTVHEAALKEVDRLKSRGDDFQADKRNLQRRHNRLFEAKQEIQQENVHIYTQLEENLTQLQGIEDLLAESNEALRLASDRERKRAKCAPLQKEQAIAKEVQQLTEWKVKAGGVITEKTREMVRSLIAMGVPQSRVGDVARSVLGVSGIKMSDTISPRSVGWITAEMFVASCLQVGSEIKQAESFTISSDGTSNKHLDYMSRHLNVTAPDYDDPTAPWQNRNRFLGITGSLNHTSETQFKCWQDTFKFLIEIFNDSPIGLREHDLSFEEFARKLTGMNTDHAEDQKKLFRLMVEWKCTSDRMSRGMGAITQMPLRDFLHMVGNAQEERIEAMGGLEAWNTLSASKKDDINKNIYQDLQHRLGEDVFVRLSPKEKSAEFLMVWTGCSMHKELNAVKGGKSGMEDYWAGTDTQPIKLMNRDNAAAAREGSTEAAHRAEARSEGGAIKFTSLAGAVLAHKDHQKDQQDTFRIFLERRLTYTFRYPDTSNTRYQSRLGAASVTLVHRNLLIKFLDLVRFKKNSSSLNHMEHNLYLGLCDTPTLIELAVLVLYSQSISHPYMRQIRQASTVNALDLGFVHQNVKAHCQTLIDNPALLLEPDAHYSTGAMDGLPWEEPEAMVAVHQLIQSHFVEQLHHVRGAFQGFLRGALKTWDRFTAEFAPGSSIDLLTPELKKKAFMTPTNDHNEGALGSFHIACRFTPNLTLLHHNGRRMFTVNDTESFLRVLTPSDLTLVSGQSPQGFLVNRV